MTATLSQTLTPEAASTTSVAAAQTTGGATALTLATTSYNYAHIVTLTSTGNISGRTFTIVGTGHYGEAVTETLTGPNNNTVSSTNYYKVITSITPDGAVGTNTSAGISAAFETTFYPLDHNTQVAPSVAVLITAGTGTFTVYESFDALSETQNYFSVTALASKSANTVALLDLHARAFKVRFTAASGLTTKIIALQSELG